MRKKKTKPSFPYSTIPSFEIDMIASFLTSLFEQRKKLRGEIKRFKPNETKRAFNIKKKPARKEKKRYPKKKKWPTKAKQQTNFSLSSFDAALRSCSITSKAIGCPFGILRSPKLLAACILTSSGFFENKPAFGFNCSSSFLTWAFRSDMEIWMNFYDTYRRGVVKGQSTQKKCCRVKILFKYWGINEIKGLQCLVDIELEQIFPKNFWCDEFLTEVPIMSLGRIIQKNDCFIREIYNQKKCSKTQIPTRKSSTQWKK